MVDTSERPIEAREEAEAVILRFLRSRPTTDSLTVGDVKGLSELIQSAMAVHWQRGFEDGKACSKTADEASRIQLNTRAHCAGILRGMLSKETSGRGLHRDEALFDAIHKIESD